MMNILSNARSENSSIKNLEDKSIRNSDSTKMDGKCSENKEKPFGEYMEANHSEEQQLETQAADKKEPNKQTSESASSKNEKAEIKPSEALNPAQENPEELKEIKSEQLEYNIQQQLEDGTNLDETRFDIISSEIPKEDLTGLLSTLKQSSELAPSATPAVLLNPATSPIPTTEVLIGKNDPTLSSKSPLPLHNYLTTAALTTNVAALPQNPALDDANLEPELVSSQLAGFTLNSKGEPQNSIIQRVETKIELPTSIQGVTSALSAAITPPKNYFSNTFNEFNSSNSFAALTKETFNPLNLTNNLGNSSNNIFSLPQVTSIVNSPSSSTLILPTAFSSPNWNMDFSNQMVWLAQQGIQSAQIRLSPPELGNIIAKLDIQQHQVHLQLIVQDNSVQQALHHSTGYLQSLFKDIDLNLVNVQISHNNLANQGNSEQQSFLNSNNAKDQSSGEGKNLENHLGLDESLTKDAPAALGQIRISEGLVDTYI